MNGFLMGFISGILISAVAGVYFYNKNKSHIHCDNRTAASSIENNANEVFVWLQTTLASFKKKYVGYLIERLRQKNHLTYEQLKDLQLEYGEINIAPSLRIHEPFSENFSDWDKLEQAEKRWLVQKNINYAETSRLHDKIEEVLVAEAKKESSKIFTEFCEKKRLNVIVTE